MKYVRGIEYACDGTAPEGFPEGVLLKALHDGNWMINLFSPESPEWEFTTKFRVVDGRPEFKPDNDLPTIYVRGIEYICDGAQPEGLADDVIVIVCSSRTWVEKTNQAYTWNWQHITKFMVTDLRPEFDPEPTSSKPVTPEWYDYLNQRQLTKPPLNVEIEYINTQIRYNPMDGDWQKVRVMFISKTFVIYSGAKNDEFSRYLLNCKFRPLDYDKPLPNADRDELIRLINQCEIDSKEVADTIIKAGWVKK